MTLIRALYEVARNSPRVGRTLIQRWWGEAFVAKVRLHVPVDYFRVAEDYRQVLERAGENSVRRAWMPRSRLAGRLPTHERHVQLRAVLANQEAHCVESLAG